MILQKLEDSIKDLEKVHGKISREFNPHDSAISFKYEDGAVYRIAINRVFTKAQLDNILEDWDYIDHEGHRYWYEYKVARHRKDFCLATEDPKKYCNGYYLYSQKDPGDGKAFVIVKTDNANIYLN